MSTDNLAKVAPRSDDSAAAGLGRTFRRIVARLSHWIDRGVSYLLALLMALLVAVVFTQLLCRYVLHIPFAASEEIATYLFIWLTFLGAAVGMKRRSHPALAFVVERLSPPIRRVVESFGIGSAAYFLGFLVIEGTSATLAVASQTSPIMEISVAFVNASLPIAAAVMLIHLLSNTIEDLDLRAQDLLVIIATNVVLYLLTTRLSLSGHLYSFVTITLIVLLLARIPISIVLGLTTLLALSIAGFPPIQLIFRMVGGLNNFILLAIPFFMLTGAIMATGTMATRLTDLANQLVGWMRGGLGMADILVSIIFADISGSAVADTAAIGSVMLPNMIKRGYDRDFATALQASAGSLGMQFPPSITMILYAWVASVSVTALFAASFMPGLLVASSFAVVTYVVARRRGYPRERGITPLSFWRALCRSFFALVTPVIILGGILGGIMTPTESGVVAVIYSFIVGYFIYRDMPTRQIASVVAEATAGAARVTFLVSTALALSWILIVGQGPQELAAALRVFTQHPIIILILINLLIIVVHTFLEPSATMLVLVPVLMPLLKESQIDPVFFGIMFVMNSAMGFLLPPVGFCLYIACGVSGASLESVTRAILPFVGAITIDLILIIFYPDIVLFLPRLLGLH